MGNHRFSFLIKNLRFHHFRPFGDIVGRLLIGDHSRFAVEVKYGAVIFHKRRMVFQRFF